MNEKKNIYSKLSSIQNELKAPKGQKNTFGKYNYRSCEDILEAVKPICKKHNSVLMLSDELVNIGERYYIKASAILSDLDMDERIINTAYARESETKKGMDESQITGTASSYARKYALNGLFNIDDTKDADTDEYTKKTKESDKKELMETPISAGRLDTIKEIIKDTGTDEKELFKYFKIKGYENINISNVSKIEEALLKKRNNKVDMDKLNKILGDENNE